MDHRAPTLAEKSPLGIMIFVLEAFFLMLGVIALGVRFRSRSLQGLSLCFNDYAVLLAWPFVAGMLVIEGFDITRGGAGQHAGNVSPQEVKVLLKSVPAKEILWVTANTLIKLSILHFYNAVFGITKCFRMVSFTLAAVVVCFAISTVLKQFLLCRPFIKEWNPNLPGACGTASANIIAEGVINMLLDIGILSLPMPLVWGLQMPQRKKINLTVIFGLGSIVCLITILRIVFAVQFDFDDFAYDYIRISITTALEPLLGILVASLPMFPPVFRERLGDEGQQDSQKRRFTSITQLQLDIMKPPLALTRLHDSYSLEALDTGIAEKAVIGSTQRAASLGLDNSTQSRV